MHEAIHRIKVFPFRLAGPQPTYLLLKPNQGIEGLWGPAQSTLGFGDQMEDAARRTMVEEVGGLAPGSLVDLQWASRFQLADELVIEWCYGFKYDADPDPSVLESHWAQARWARFSEAFESLEMQADRTAVMRLHALISAA